MLELFNKQDIEGMFICFMIIFGIILIKWVYQFRVWLRRERIEIELLKLLQDMNRNKAYLTSGIEDELKNLKEDEYISYTKLRR